MMSNVRFDDLTAALATGGTRRGVVAAAIGALLGVGGLERAAGAARATCRRSGTSCTRASQCCTGYCENRRGAGVRRNRCACPAGQTACNGVCQDLLWDREHCGACGNRCTDADVCTEGVCTGCDDYPGFCWIDVEGRAWGGTSYNSDPERLPCETTADCQASSNCDLGRCACLATSFLIYGTEIFYTPDPPVCIVTVNYPAHAR